MSNICQLYVDYMHGLIHHLVAHIVHDALRATIIDVDDNHDDDVDEIGDDDIVAEAFTRELTDLDKIPLYENLRRDVR